MSPRTIFLIKFGGIVLEEVQMGYRDGMDHLAARGVSPDA